MAGWRRRLGLLGGVTAVVAVGVMAVPVRVMAAEGPPAATVQDVYAAVLNVRDQMSLFRTYTESIWTRANDAANLAWGANEGAYNALLAAREARDNAAQARTHAANASSLAYTAADNSHILVARTGHIYGDTQSLRTSVANVGASVTGMGSTLTDARNLAYSAADTSFLMRSELGAARAAIISAVDAVGNAVAAIEGGGAEAGPAGDAMLALVNDLWGRLASEPCRTVEVNPWWASLTSPRGLADSDCDVRRQDVRELGERVAQGFGGLAPVVEGLRDAVDGAAQDAAEAASRAEDLARRVAEAVERTADAVEAAGESGPVPVPAWASGVGRMPRLEGWAGAATCMVPTVPAGGSMCGYGPVIPLGPIDWQPLSYCGDLSPLSRWRPVLGAFLVLGAAWTGLRWIMGALGVPTPGTGD